MMKYFLVDFDRAEETAAVTSFDNEAEALAEYSRRERQAFGTNHEVVLLGAESEDDLHQTHARYFYDIGEMSDRALSQLKRPLVGKADSGT